MGGGHSVQIVPYLRVRSPNSPASSWLSATCVHSLYTSSPLAKLIKSFILTSCLPWSILGYSQGKLVILFSSKPLCLVCITISAPNILYHLHLFPWLPVYFLKATNYILFKSATVGQWFSTLTSLCNHLESFKKIHMPGKLPQVSHLVWGLALIVFFTGLFLNAKDNFNVQPTLRITALVPGRGPGTLHCLPFNHFVSLCLMPLTVRGCSPTNVVRMNHQNITSPWKTKQILK